MKKVQEIGKESSEATTEILRSYINGHVKLEDFTTRDKELLLITFLMNHDLLDLVYKSLFPSTAKVLTKPLNTDNTASMSNL